MAQSDHHLLTQSNYYNAAIGLAIVLSASAMAYGRVLFSAFSLALAVVLILGKFKAQPKDDEQSARSWLQWASIAFTVLALLGLLFGTSETKPWLFAAPLLIFFFYEFRPAMLIVAGLSVVGSLILAYLDSPLHNIQFVITYILALGIGCALVYLREVRRKQLKPLRRTDNLTQAATQEHLEDDLRKEIQRSEREGSELAVMAMTIDENCLESLSKKQRSSAMIELGRLLHNNLRVFDSYYLWSDEEFLIVLPHTSSAQANKIANELRVKARKEIKIGEQKISTSLGIAGLNVGDDAKALPEKAAEALRLSLRNGSNRTQLYRDTNGISDNTETRGERA